MAAGVVTSAERIPERSWASGLQLKLYITLNCGDGGFVYLQMKRVAAVIKFEGRQFTLSWCAEIPLAV